MTLAHSDRALSHFWYWHLLYWLSYLLVKFTHLTVLVPLQNEAAWPYLLVYAGITLINILFTGLVGSYELRRQRPLAQQLTRLLVVLLPFWLCQVVLRQVLMMEYATDNLDEVESLLKYFVAFMLVLLPLAGWLAIFMLIKVNQIHYQSVVKQQQLARQARQARLKVLRYQLNPHFMFNTLNALNSLIVQREGQKAELLIEQLSVYLRHSLQNQQDDFIGLKQELDALQAYMAIQQLRFGERLTVHWQLDNILPEGSLADLRVPPLILQPLAENAVQYCVAEVSGEVSLSVGLSSDNGFLHITIAQTGSVMGQHWPAGEQPANLLNLAERLQLLFGSNSNLNLSIDNPAFYSRISLPLESLHGHH